MNTYTSLPGEIVGRWPSSDQTHPALKKIDFHYHDVEEWLEVRRGEITFFTVSEQPRQLGAGSVLHIPRGEVHRVEIGANGVEYRMYVPVEVGSGFANRLTADELEMLRVNLEFPLREENTDGRAAEFFARHLSEALAFCRADGTVVCKNEVLREFTARGRASSGTVCVLNRTPKGILLSTVVTVGHGSPNPRHFTNIRLFAGEGGNWKCRMWVNYPE